MKYTVHYNTKIGDKHKWQKKIFYTEEEALKFIEANAKDGTVQNLTVTKIARFM